MSPDPFYAPSLSQPNETTGPVPVDIPSPFVFQTLLFAAWMFFNVVLFCEERLLY